MTGEGEETLGKDPDPKKRQEAVVRMAKLTEVPLPKVSAVLQEYPPDGSSGTKCLEDCEKPAALQMRKMLKEGLKLWSRPTGPRKPVT